MIENTPSCNKLAITYSKPGKWLVLFVSFQSCFMELPLSQRANCHLLQISCESLGVWQCNENRNRYEDQRWIWIPVNRDWGNVFLRFITKKSFIYDYCHIFWASDQTSVLSGNTDNETKLSTFNLFTKKSSLIFLVTKFNVKEKSFIGLSFIIGCKIIQVRYNGNISDFIYACAHYWTFTITTVSIRWHHTVIIVKPNIIVWIFSL